MAGGPDPCNVRCGRKANLEDEIDRLRAFIRKLLDSETAVWFTSAIEAGHPGVDFEKLEQEARALLGESS